MKTIKISFLLCTVALLAIACTKECECTITEEYSRPVPAGYLGGGITVITSGIRDKPKDKSCKQMGEDFSVPSSIIIQADSSVHSYIKNTICK
jgi:hypothetical protein